MKFFDGWIPKKNHTVFNALRIEQFYKDEKSLTAQVCCDPKRAKHHPVPGTLMNVRFSSPMPGIIKVSMVHHSGSLLNNPSFIEDTECPVDIYEEDTAVYCRSGNLTVKVHKGEGYRTEFLVDGKKVTGSCHNKMAYIKYSDERTETSFVKEELDLSVGEYVYGLGERFSPFVKNGQSIDMFNWNAGTNTDQVYKNIPFYLSNKGYGVLVNDSGRVAYEIGTENMESVQFSIPGEALEYCVVAGPSLHTVLERYTDLTGKPALPPAWTFGLWLTTSFTTDYNEETVNHFIDGMKERDIPLHVFHFDCFWMKGSQWCNFDWDPDGFPEPEAMLRRLKAKGLKICLWINSYVAQSSRLFEEGRRNGYFIKNSKGGVWQTDDWQPGMAIVDFTNPSACEWYANELRRLVDMGVDTFKTDFGERIPVDGVYFDGSDPEKMHNYYAQLYNKTVFEVLEKKLGVGEAMLFARSATAGGQKYPVHWGGDNTANYSSMAESLRGGLSLTTCGFGFWSHDISGFGNTATPDLYKRWSAFGMLSTHSRLHGNDSYRVPWMFDEEAVDVLRKFSKLKCSLMPYLFSSAVDTHRTGIPMMRAMILDYQNDPTCAFLDRQYMLGDSLLAAPIISDDGVAEYYLPAGKWTNLLSNKVMEGEKWYKESFDYMNMPLLVRPNTLLAIGENQQDVVYDYAQNVTLHLFEPTEGLKSTATIRSTDASDILTAEALLEKGVLTISVETEKESWQVCLRNIHQTAQVVGASTEENSLGLMLIPKKGMKTIQITL